MKTLMLFIAIFAVTITTPAIAQDDYNYATYYIVVADTNLNYEILDQKMYTLSQEMNRTVDTMGRSYNAEKDLIALAEDDADDLWAGHYYPRRYPSEHFSLEYLNWYSTANEKTIALVAGIYETSSEAKAALKNLKSLAPEAFVVKAEVYVGCLH